jgi:group II intron reverse transcriptase/maturase
VQAQITWGYRKVIDADLKACFASLPHNGIIAAVSRRMRDPWMLRLLRRWLTAGILDEGMLRTAVAGTPEGGVVSPLLANAYMHAFDAAWETKMRGIRLMRYGADSVMLCRGNSQPGLQRMEKRLTGLGLTLNADKTRIVEAADGFDFLGRHLRRKPMRSNPKRLFCSRWSSTRAMQSMRHKIRDAIGYDDLSSLEEKLRAINPLVRGWGQSCRSSNAQQHFKKMDAYVYTKLVGFLRRKHKRRGKGYRACPPSFLKKAGLYQLHGTVVHTFRTPLGERGRKAGGGKSSCPV